MKKKNIIFVLCLLFGLSSCENFLQRDPLDFGDGDAFLRNVSDMANYNNTFYKMFPGINSGGWGGVYAEDNNSDNQVGSYANSLFYRGDKYTPLIRESEWRFDDIRNLNYFFTIVNQRIQEGGIAGSPTQIDHYLGEAYFFKAYDYFRLLTRIGDVPIIDQVYGDSFEELRAVGKRVPRNEVARYILKLLDKSYALMLPTPPQQGRLSKDAAMLFKARVALFEATWEKYHQGTAFVPGNNKWPGHSTYPDFKFEGGSIQSEYNFFFDQAIAASDIVASKRNLYDNYIDLFNDTKNSAINSAEVILAKFYMTGINAHAGTHYLKRTGAGTGYTRSLVQSFLTTNGLPIYADPTYKGDKVMYEMLQNRDTRLVKSVKTGGFVTNNTNPLKIDTLVNYKPQIWVSGNQGTPTGYEVNKWISQETQQDITPTSGTSATPIFRAAEAYLIYLEATYERTGALGGNCDKYWKALRKRAKISEDYMATIAATDLSKEIDLATKSKNQFVDATLYNIRRERRNEFIAEGMRLFDLKRWRSLDHMVSYHVEGMNLWDDIYKIYTAEQIRVGQTVSSSANGVYMRPFQIVATSIVYDGYNFPKQHYLEPIPVSEIILTSTPNQDDSPIYQNPGWPRRVAGTADYSFDCD